MSITRSIRSLPRYVVGGYLGAARFPLSFAGKLTGKNPQEWPPILAFENFEAGVETSLGLALKDDVLVERGTVRRARVDQLRRAVELEAAAEDVSEQSQQEFEQRRAQAD